MKRPTWSISTPLMQRTVCPACGHMHRHALADKCACCKKDGAK